MLLQVDGLTKRFPGVLALCGVQLRVAAGETHALLGENGAGKSTLLKILSGAQAQDEGAIRFGGVELDRRDTPLARQRLGVATIYQEFNLLPEMSVAENLFLGREPLRRGLLDWRALIAAAEHALADLGLRIPARAPVRTLSVAEQQMVEIARAMTLDARLIIMDEPTAALSAREVDKLHDLIRDLKGRGISVIYVTHRLGEVAAVCDRFTVLRDGRFVRDGEVKDVTSTDLVRAMVGRDVEFERAHVRPERGPLVLRAEGVRRAAKAADPHATVLKDLRLEVYAGEVLGLAGLVGAGRSELARIIFGADKCDGGVLWLDGRERRLLQSPARAIDEGLALVPEDRKREGCFLEHSVRWNLSLPSLKRLSRGGVVVDEAAERELVETYRKSLGIRFADDQVAIGTLSGGNQQKVLLARCLALAPKVLIVDEPTRGIDVAAKAEVHRLLRELAGRGVAVVTISSELPEVLAVSDRIVAFRDGQVTGELDAREASEQRLMQLMAFGAAA